VYIKYNVFIIQVKIETENSKK